MAKELNICFVALNAYAALSGRTDLTHIGGAEKQQVLLARGLQARGHRVSFVTLNQGQADGIQHDGITVYRTYAPNAGLPGMRFIHPRWTSLWAAMARANADVYYKRCADYEVGQAALWCRCHSHLFIYAAASDSDCLRSLPRLQSLRERIFYRWGLHVANHVICQTATQQRLMQEQFSRSSTIVPSCCPPPPNGAPRQSPVESRAVPRVLWIGRISTEKRFEWFLDVAERCPSAAFDVIGTANTASGYAAALIHRAAGIPNITMHGLVPHSEMAAYYRRATVLCCTSDYEGFPNTFLEAWGLGTPVVSTFDPDGVITKYGMGWITDTVEGLVEHLSRVIASPKLQHAASVAARRYIAKNHTVEASVEQLDLVIRKTYIS